MTEQDKENDRYQPTIYDGIGTRFFHVLYLLASCWLIFIFIMFDEFMAALLFGATPLIAVCLVSYVFRGRI